MIAWTLRTLWTHLGRPLEATPRYRTGRVTAGPAVGAPVGAGKDGQTMTTGIITTLRDRGDAIVPAEEADPSDRARPRAVRVTPLAAGDPATPGTP